MSNVDVNLSSTPIFIFIFSIFVSTHYLIYSHLYALGEFQPYTSAWVAVFGNNNGISAASVNRIAIIIRLWKPWWKLDATYEKISLKLRSQCKKYWCRVEASQWSACKYYLFVYWTLPGAMWRDVTGYVAISACSIWPFSPTLGDHRS